MPMIQIYQLQFKYYFIQSDTVKLKVVGILCCNILCCFYSNILNNFSIFESLTYKKKIMNRRNIKVRHFKINYRKTNWDGMHPNFLTSMYLEYPYLSDNLVCYLF